MEEKTYNCPKCKKRSMVITDKSDVVEGVCKECGYKFVDKKGISLDIIKMIHEYGGMLAIIAIILMLVTFTSLDGQFGDMNTRINVIDSKVIDNVNILNDTITVVKANIDNVKYDITGILARLATTENDIGRLTNFYTVVTTINNNISNINENISSISENITELWVKVNSMTSEDIVDLLDMNLTFTHFANQTGTERYCRVNFSVGSNQLEIEEVKFGIRYEKVNITLFNSTDTIKPQEHQWLNINYTDNYFLHWFGHNESFNSKYNFTWNINNYNTSNLTSTNIKYSLMVNSILVNMPEIWEVEHD